MRSVREGLHPQPSMRFLHTADWHLGRTFHGASLLDAQAQAVEHTVAVARDEQVDAILLAGDVFDRALPPREAVQLWDEALTQMAACCPVIVISGNHDSPTRLGYGATLLERADVHLHTHARQCGTPVMVGSAAIYPIPYLEPDVVRAELGCQERSHEAVLTAAMARVRADLAVRPAGTRSVVMAHAFIAGAEISASERDLTVGGSASAPPAVFAGAGYLALGHLHGPQRVGSIGRYAGSPVPFSFSEAGQTKSVTVVDLSGAEATTVQHPVPVARPLVLLRGELETLLSDPALREHEGSWVHATLTDRVRPREAMARLRTRFPHAAELTFAPEGVVAAPVQSYASRTRGASDIDLVLRFVSDLRGESATDAERELLTDALAARRHAEAAA